MTKVVTPSPITDGQIEKATDVFRAALRKNRSRLDAGTFQQVLGMNDIGKALFAVFCERSEAIGGVIVHHVKVNRHRSFERALEATGFRFRIGVDMLATIPEGSGNNVEVIFFKCGRLVSSDDLEKEYEMRGLVPADPYSLAAVNEGNPTFVDNYPNCTNWKDKNGEWYGIAFRHWTKERSVLVINSHDGWGGYWWFAGRRK